jgi:hypothetical protein
VKDRYVASISRKFSLALASVQLCQSDVFFFVRERTASQEAQFIDRKTKEYVINSFDVVKGFFYMSGEHFKVNRSAKSGWTTSN